MFDLGGRQIGGDSSFTIAEIGHNHGGNLDTACELVRQAAWAGADAVKFQKRENEDLYTKAFLDTPYNSENAFGPTYGIHRHALEFGANQYRVLSDLATELGMVCFATAFDTTSVDFCVLMGLPALKIASGSITNIPLLAYAARTGLPIFLSTGASHITDVDRAVDALTTFTDKICILQCTATYPSAWSELDLNVISTYKNHYPDLVIGLSSHVNGIAEGPVAYGLGARVFEKHLTLDRSMKGSDHPFSLEPQGFKKFVRDLKRAEVMLGDGMKRCYLSEMPARTKMGSGVYFSRPLKAGTVIEARDLVIKTPAAFVEPYEIPRLIGREVLNDVSEQDPVTWEVVFDVQQDARVS